MDERELICKAKEGDEKAIQLLLDEYKGLVNFLSRKYFLINAEFSDIVQEGMIGLFNACRTFNEKGSTSFKTYASVCIKRQIQTALSKNNRAKDIPLNTYVSITNQGKVLLRPAEDEDEAEDDDIGFFVQSNTLNPEENILFREKLKELAHKMNSTLSLYERKVLRLFMQGESYVEIAKKLNQSTKSVDNALSRIKHKLRQNEEEE